MLLITIFNNLVTFECIHRRQYLPQKDHNPFKHRISATSKCINCPFHINVRSPKNLALRWYITTIVDMHNHNFQAIATIQLHQDQKLTQEMIDKIQHYTKANIILNKMLILLRIDFPNHNFIPRNVMNIIAKMKQESNSNLSQAAQLLVILQDRQNEDDQWFIQKDIDETGCLRRLFWMEPQQRELYLQYHDVILNDSTAQTNHFNMPLNTFLIVDSNGNSRLVACALISGEMTEDYEWILQ